MALACVQVETGGLALTSCVLSSTGEVWALGDSCGCVRVWSEPTLPRVHAAALHLEVRRLSTLRGGCDGNPTARRLADAGERR